MEKGDLVYIDYDVWVLPEDEDGEDILFDTTSREKAEEEEILNEDATYGPRSIEIGSGQLLQGLEEALLEAEIGEKDSVEIPPEKAMGNRSPGEIDLFSRRELNRKGVDITEGAEVEIDGRMGTIIQATAGRVRVDFNHPLAGKSLRVDYEITKKAETEEEKVKHLLEKNYGKADFKITLEEGSLQIVLSEDCKYGQQWLLNKFTIVADLRKNLEVETIQFIEEYEGEKEEEVESLEEEDLEELAEDLDEEEEIVEETPEEDDEE